MSPPARRALPLERSSDTLTLDEVRALAATDMAAVDQAIRTRLHSAVPLVETIAEHIIAGGGKRLRPLVVVLSAHAATGRSPADARYVDAAAFIEFIHTATLLHDDVVDHSTKRRGRDTANALFGNEASVLVGDFVYSRAFQVMAATRSQRVIEIMADATNVIAEGEVLQLMNAHDPETTEQRYLDVIHRKTARLFEAGAEVAAVLAGAPEPVQKALGAFGRHLGAAFQLIDDVLDYRSDPAARGKNLGEDLLEGKPTLPLIHAIRTSSAEVAARLREAITEPEGADLAAVIAAIDATGGIDYTRRAAEAEAERACECLSSLPPSVHRDALEVLALASVDRDR